MMIGEKINNNVNARCLDIHVMLQEFRASNEKEETKQSGV